MNENNAGSGSAILTVRIIIKALSVLCIVFFFCPSFFVACSGQKMKISAVGTAVGMKVGDQKFDAHPVLFILLLIPIAVLVIMFLKAAIKERIASILVPALLAVDFIVWMVFRGKVKDAAEQYYCDFGVTAWFVIDMILLFIMIGLALICAIGALNPDRDLLKGSTHEIVTDVQQRVTELTQGLASEISNRTQRPSQGPGGYAQGPSAGPAGYPQGPQNYNQGPAGYPQGPQNYNQGPAGYPQGPQNYNQGPAGYPQGPQNYNQRPANYAQGPAAGPVNMVPQQQAASFCANCGKPLAPSSQFCPACGSPVIQ